jgi:HPt (histidine-containing phosphotransfer) domain-containing protein
MKSKNIDLEYLNEVSGGNTGLILEMIQIFNSEVPGYLKLMKEFYSSGNWVALGRLAHKAKASASIMGMNNLANELKNLELLTQEKSDPQPDPSILGTIEDQFLVAIEELKSFAMTLK